MLNIFKRKSQYMVAAEAFLKDDFRLTSAGKAFVLGQEDSRKHSPFFVAGVVYINAVCNWLNDCVFDDSVNILYKNINYMEISSPADYFISTILDMSDTAHGLSEEEMILLRDMRPLIRANSRSDVESMLRLGVLARPVRQLASAF